MKCDCCNNEIVEPNRIESQYSYTGQYGELKIKYECSDCAQKRRNKELQFQLDLMGSKK